MDEKLVKRFEAKVEKGEGCWNWTASTAGMGYGQIKLPRQRRQIYAHRLSWMIYRGELPEDRQVLHRCDNPRCVNPDHLFLGTAADNAQDMAAKNRSTHGVRNPRAKLTEEQVRQVRLCVQSGVPQSRIAVAFGVLQPTISKIARGQRWRRIKE